jgi:argininosuccinate synthase
MVDVAKEVGADAVAHGCTGKGNDQACLTNRSNLTTTRAFPSSVNFFGLFIYSGSL